MTIVCSLVGSLSLTGREMPAQHRLYVDSDGVKRGYYVYLHRDRATGKVFYVGKGSGRRAWDDSGRNPGWKEMVASLTNGWDVEIIEEDLSEIEAFEREARLVEQHGGCAATGGTLTNWVPGGEVPASIELRIQFDDGGWSAAYYDARKFKDLPRRRQETLARRLNRVLDAIIRRCDVLEMQADDNDDDKLSDYVGGCGCTIGSLSDASSDFLRRRASWKDLALAVEDALDDLESEMEDIAKHQEEVRSLFKRALKVVASLLREIDTGNRKEAEETATRMTGRA